MLELNYGRPRRSVVVGASSGGVETLTAIVSGLPKDLDASLFMVLHVLSRSESRLSQILTRAGKLRADNEPVQKGRIYIAPPDFHLLLQERSVRLVRGPRENNHRPAIDPTFRTAAQSYGPRVIGMVLSGALDDGTAGLAAIEKRDGVAVIQDPKDALFPEMPRNASEAVDIDYCKRRYRAASGPALAGIGHGESLVAGSGRDGERIRDRGDGNANNRK